MPNPNSWFAVGGVDIRIAHCTVGWGYRERAVTIAEALRRKCGANVEIGNGTLGQFDVWIDGKPIISRRASIVSWIRPPRLPEVTTVLAAIEGTHSAGTTCPDFTKATRTPRELAPADAKRFCDHFGARQDAQF